MSLRLNRHDSLYLYPQLDTGGRTIRLINLLPGEFSAPVHCQLVETKLSPTLSYKALSYSWRGDDASPSHDATIICNSKPVQVSANLCTALRRLRSPHSPLNIWVDAICINQQDDAERARQVGLMRDIYQTSEEVCIWLGESGACDDMGYGIEPELLCNTHENPNIVRWYGDARDIPKLKAYFSMGSMRGDETRCDIFGAFSVLHLLASGVPVHKIWHLRHVQFSSGIVNGLNAIMEKAWWRRIWVVQETVVARAPVIYYGSMCAPWRLFALAAVEYDKGRAAHNHDGAFSLLKSGHSLMQFARVIMEIESTRRSWQRAEPLVPLTLLRKFRSRQSTDARDKVFAVLGIIRNWGIEKSGEAMEAITANYSVDSNHIFFKTTELLIRNTRSLAVLAGTLQGPLRGLQAQYSSMPSWVTDWSYPPTTNEHIRVGNISLYDTAKYLSGRVSLHKKSILEAQGSIIDKVDYVGPVLENEIGQTRARLIVQEWRKSLAAAEDSEERLEGRYVGGGSLYAAFWRTLCADLEFIQYSELSNYVREFRRIPEPVVDSAAYEGWLRVGEQSHRRTSLVHGLWVEPTNGEMETKSKNVFQYILECASGGRRFFRTKQGYIGTGPADMRAGDSVAVLLGSRVPFILRGEYHLTERCFGQEIRTLFRLGSAYFEAGKGARVEKDEATHCYSSHQHCHRVVGDAYVHGIMDGDIKRTNSWNIGPIYMI